MRITLGWARCAADVADVLRRGAWYPVIEESPDGHLVVEVRNQRVRLRRGDVEIRTEVPDHWSVVVRTAVLRPTPGGDGGRRHLRRVPAVPLPPGLRREAGEAALCPLRRDVASGLDGDLLRRDIRPQTLEIVIILTVNMLMISRSGVSSLTSDV